MSIHDLYKQFPDVHPNIVLKTAILRRGISITNAASQNFKKRDDLLWKGYHLFSYDLEETKVYKKKVPWVIHLEDGCPIPVRASRESPYSIDYIDGEFVIRENNENVARNVYFERKPRWYDMRTEGGIDMPAIAQGCSQVVFVTMTKYCDMWKSGEECLFCNIITTLKDQKVGGEDVVAYIDPEVIAEVVKTAMTTDPHYSRLFLTGGTILGTYKGQTELEFYVTRLNAIREKLQVWPPTVFQIAAQNDEGWKRLHDTGVPTIEPNIEVWDKKLFKWICPGKEKVIGYDEWIRRTIRAVDFWGPGRVNPNFVIGVEMAKPYGFEDVSSAVKSTASGWDFLMDHGVLPRFNLWTIEPGSRFANQTMPPLEYFIEVQKAYIELCWKHKYDPPYPAAGTFYSYWLDSLQDFEYYHGTGTTSRRYLSARLGVTPDDMGSYDEDGFKVCSKDVKFV